MQRRHLIAGGLVAATLPHWALAQALEEGVAVTDEASAMEWTGQAPRLIEGRADNLKVTRPEDLHYLQSIWPQDR